MYGLSQLFGIAFLLFGSGLGWIVRSNIRDGVLTRKGHGLIRREDRPLQFTLTLVVRGAIALVAVVLGVAAIVGL